MAYKGSIRTIGDLKKFISERNIEDDCKVAFERIDISERKVKNVDLQVIIDATEKDVTILFSEDSLNSTDR